MDALSSIGSTVGKILPGALTAGGFINNLLTQRTVNARQNFVENLIKNPVAMQKYIAGFTQPLSKGLTQNVGNEVQGYLGERGLSYSPAISGDVMAQALAPYQQQEQQMGVSAALQSLGMTPGAPGPMSNVSGPLALLLRQLNPTPGQQTQQQPLQVNPGYDPGLILPDPTQPVSTQQPDWGSILGIGSDSQPTFAGDN